MSLFVVHEHQSRTHHFDFRLEYEGVLKSWVLPKGVPEIVGVRRLAIQVEDHPLAFADFEGTIPEGQYGAGSILISDRGTYDLGEWHNDRIAFTLHGKRFQGAYNLVHFRIKGGRNWLLLKRSSRNHEVP